MQEILQGKLKELLKNENMQCLRKYIVASASMEKRKKRGEEIMKKNPKMVVCRKCNTPFPKKTKRCPNCGKKYKKPIYKRVWFIILVLILLVSLTKGADNKPEKIEWNSLVLSKQLPEPDLKKGNISTDSDSYLSVSFQKATDEDFKEYIETCKNMGYVEESYRSDSSYSAYRKDGYQLDLWYKENKKTLEISLYAPAQMDYLTMPKSGLGSTIPVPDSIRGTILKDSTDRFSVRVGETPKEAFRDYVKACEDAGFVVDYDKKDTTFSAYNEEGAFLKVTYISFQMMDITVDAPKEIQETIETQQTTESKESAVEDNKTEETASETKEEAQGESKEVSSDGLRPEFKEAMDSYEAFYVEYCELFKKYSKNPTDLSLIAQYTKMMQEAVEMTAAFEKWDQDEMNTAELKYYLEVNGRVTAMLIEVGSAQ